MPFTVTTYKSVDQLAAALTADVTFCKDEDQLEAVLEAATGPYWVVTNGIMYTVIDAPAITFVNLQIVAKGIMYTVILETA